jgi:hypothetical protein
MIRREGGNRAAGLEDAELARECPRQLGLDETRVWRDSDG